jgi:hypothetical protein
VPVTPFHLGPALIVKAACPRQFSLGAFALVQVAIDVEPIWNILAGRWPVHARLHTLAGALLIAVALIVPARLGLPALYRAADRALRAVQPAGWPAWLRPGPGSWTSVSAGALVGGLSHVLLDAVVHSDVRPFAPWSAANPFLVRGSFVWMHLGCALAGAVGLLAWHALSVGRGQAA